MEITVKTTNHGHIRDQQVKVYKNSCFVFNFTSFEFLTVFSTAVLTGVTVRPGLRRAAADSARRNFRFLYGSSIFSATGGQVTLGCIRRMRVGYYIRQQSLRLSLKTA